MATQTITPTAQTAVLEEQKPKEAPKEAPRGRPPSSEEVSVGFMSEASFVLLQRVAAIYANAKLVPDVFKGNVSDCAIAVNMAHRLNADPMMIMQNIYIVYGRPGWLCRFERGRLLYRQ